MVILFGAYFFGGVANLLDVIGKWNYLANVTVSNASDANEAFFTFAPGSTIYSSTVYPCSPSDSHNNDNVTWPSCVAPILAFANAQQGFFWVYEPSMKCCAHYMDASSADGTGCKWVEA